MVFKLVVDVSERATQRMEGSDRRRVLTNEELSEMSPCELL